MMNKLPNIFYSIIILILYCSIVYGQNGRDQVSGNLIQFNDNGAWCWFQDERAVVDTNNGKLILGSVANQFGQGPSRDGDINNVIYDLQTGLSQRYVLAKGNSNFYGSDDHNAPAFLVLPNGNYLTFYAGHNNNNFSYYHRYSNGVWGPQYGFDWNAHISGGVNFQSTYSNLFYLSSEGRAYNFSRGNNKSPNFMYSTDMGNTWSYGGQLTMNDNTGYVNGYLKYWSNGVDRIDFVCTELHPRDSSTSVYHGYIKNGQSFKSDGTLVDSTIYQNTNVPTPQTFTKVFANGTIINGDTLERCWIVDLARYSDGSIATIVSSRANNNQPTTSTINPNPDHRFVYCRYDGTKWTYTYLGKAGLKLYSSEQDYTGLGALCPDDPNTLYISTTIDPRSNASLGVHEIFKGVTTDKGATWNWAAITGNSVRDNLRPIVPAWKKNNTALLWWRGTYTSAQLFDAAVVGILDSTSENTSIMSYLDANASNTFMADGSPLIATGPDSNAGPSGDNKWHMRTGVGNNGTVLTSSEISGENAPMIKTQVNITTGGTYDVWVNFWGTPASDWRIKAGLSVNSMQLFRSMACKEVDNGSHDVNLTLSGSGNTFLYQAYLGRVQVSDNGSFNVFVDDSAVQVGTASTLRGDVDRTWYDGVSYAKVSTAVIVPVELTSFTANAVNNVVELDWITATENNNLGFEVQRLDYGRWVRIGFVNGKGNSTEISRYSFTDNNASGSNLEYRLKQIDLNGSFKYSNIIAVILNIVKQYELKQNYPNPFNPSTTIAYSLPIDNHVIIKIYNILGQEVATLVDKEVKAGSYNITWTAQNLSSDVYFYKMTAGNFSKINKLMLLK